MPKRSRNPSQNAKRSRRKRSFKKTTRRSVSSKLMLTMARRAVLRNCETKYKDGAQENITLYHNGGVASSYVILGNLLSTPQGNGQHDHVGDEIYPIALNVRLWLSGKNDRPNVMYRVFIIATPPDQVTAGSPNSLFQGTSGNKMIDYINTDKYNIKYHTLLKPQGGDYSLETSATLREHSRYLNFYLPLSKYGKLSYTADAGTTPKLQKHCLSLGVIAYDAFGTLTSDAIATYAVTTRFYFKDP